MKTLALPKTDWLHALQNNREKALTQLYKRTFPMVLHYVRQHGGTEQDAKDVFHDALIIFYEKVVAGTLILTAAPSTYVMSICRNLWLRELDKQQRKSPLDPEEDNLPADLLEEETDLPNIAVNDYLARLGDKCRNLLESFYYFKQSLEQIAESFDYSGVRSATVQKFKCLERLRNMVKKSLTHSTEV